MLQKEKVLDYIRSRTSLDELHNSLLQEELIGVSALDIENTFNIVRNNSSTLLNKLYKDSLLIKINSRPVTFIYAKHLSDLGYKESSYSLQNIKNILKSLMSKNDVEINNNNLINDPFCKLIGHSSSLLNQITKAKAAILYPPNGLNTLILGESGVGKTTFANAMYEFAKQNKHTNEDIPFISFNCSDYFNNPHLLLSQLFGHVKGAFTGADKDKEGLVEKANNGILFLDEIHRLSADGQEMLFYLMDNGMFNRLGETSKTRKSNVLIIAATTENPDDVLLNTFLRRIPVTLKLPSFCERSIDERILIIKNLFIQEAYNLNVPLKISSDVFKSLWLYNFSKGNLGQLYSEVKLLCAKGFLNYVKENSKTINITYSMLNKDISSHCDDIDDLTKNFYNLDDEFIHIKNDITNNDNPLMISSSIDNNIYKNISNKLLELKTLNLSDDEIEDEISNMIQIHYKSISSKFNTTNINLSYLDKIIDPNIVSFSSSLINYASLELQVAFSDKFTLLLSMHIQSLINRLINGISVKKLNLKKIQSKYKKEFNVAEYFFNQISEKFNLTIPEYEKGFLTMLLTNNKENVHPSDISILVLCHGDSTAKSMSSVANTILDSSIVKFIDMPLSTPFEEFYEKVLSIVKCINPKEGILLLVDMGSLVSIGERVYQETNIKVKTISNVSTLTVLESLRQVLLYNYTLEEIHNNLSNTFGIKTYSKNKKNAILTLCATGKGSSFIAKNIILDLLKDNEALKNIEIIPIEYDNHLDTINNLKDSYHILACIGNLRPKIDLSYFSIHQIFTKGFDTQLKNFLLNKINPNLEDNKSESSDVYEKAVNILSKYVKFINPRICVNSIRKFIEKIDKYILKSDELLDIILHMGCMMDRCIRGHFAIFDNKDDFINIFSDTFDDVRYAISILEDDFDLKIPDDEVCFTIQVLNRNN